MAILNTYFYEYKTDEHNLTYKVVEAAERQTIPVQERSNEEAGY